MRGNLKALGLALLAAFAMSAVVVSSAQALTTGKFTAAGFPAVATGAQEGVVGTNFFESTPGRKIECTTAKYESTLTEASSTITVTPHYAGCTTEIGGSKVNATVTLNGCDFTFHAETVTTSTDVHGSVSVHCPKGGSITVTAGTCVIHITGETDNENANLKKVTYTNVDAAADYVTVDAEIEGIKTHETDGFLCPFEGDSTPINGKFFSKVKVDGFNDTGNSLHSTDTASNHVTQYTHSKAQNIHVK
jgi:hypothetical protein